MKRFFLVLICIVMIATACACGEGNDVSAPEVSEYQSIEDNTLSVTFPSSLPANITLPENITPSLLETLNKRLNNQEFGCSMYYCDLETGFSISYNGDRVFGAASLIKAPYLLFIFDKIKSGEITLDSEYTYQKAKHQFMGTGTIQYMPDGTVLTVREIIEHMVIESDNTGFKMMYTEILPVYQMHQLSMSQYKAPFYSGVYGNIATANGVGAIFTEVYRRAKAGDEDALWFIELLKQANENKFIRGGLPTDANGECIFDVAHKYGEDIKSLNDAAIVFCGDRPYLLVVLTDWIGIRTESFINRVSTDIYNIHMELTK